MGDIVFAFLSILRQEDLLPAASSKVLSLGFSTQPVLEEDQNWDCKRFHLDYVAASHGCLRLITSPDFVTVKPSESICLIFKYFDLDLLTSFSSPQSVALFP